MTDIENQMTELINAGIDDELSEAQRDQLRELLQVDSEAQLMQAELVQVSQALDQMEEVIPPQQIRDYILDAAAPTASSITLRLISALLPSATIPRYAMAFVGGLVFGAAALQLGEGYRSGMDPSQFVGTMTDYGALPHAITADNIRLEMDQITGSIRLHQISSMLVLEFNLDSASAVEVFTEFSGQTVDFKGLSLLENELSSFTANDESVRLVTRGSHRYSIFLENTQQSETDINIRFLTDGELFHQDTLKSPSVK